MSPKDSSEQEDAVYNGEAIPQPPQRWTRTEQLELLMWHPAFTGQCPQCRQHFSQGEGLAGH